MRKPWEESELIQDDEHASGSSLTTKRFLYGKVNEDPVYGQQELARGNVVLDKNGAGTFRSDESPH